MAANLINAVARAMASRSIVSQTILKRPLDRLAGAVAAGRAGTMMTARDYVFGRYRLRPGRELTADGVPVAVGAKALDILATLVAAAGELVTKSELMERVWPGLVVEEHNIQVHVSALRKVL